MIFDDVADNIYQTLPEGDPDVLEMRRRRREPDVPRLHEGPVLRRGMPSREGIENKHSNNIKSTDRVRVSVELYEHSPQTQIMLRSRFECLLILNDPRARRSTGRSTRNSAGRAGARDAGAVRVSINAAATARATWRCRTEICKIRRRV